MAYNQPKVNKPAQTEAKNQPEQKFRAGSVTATVWRNNGTKKDGTTFNFLSVNLQRSYTNDKGEWQNTDSLRTNDVPRAILALQRAWDYINSPKSPENNQEEQQ